MGRMVCRGDTRVASLRAAAKGEGQPLTRVNAAALAGKWYSWFLAQHEADTRLASHWVELRDYFVGDVIGREAPDEYKADTDADPHWEWAKAPAVRDAVRPVVAEMARVASFLSSAGMSLDAPAYKLFTNAVSDLLFGASAYSNSVPMETSPRMRRPSSSQRSMMAPQSAQRGSPAGHCLRLGSNPPSVLGLQCGVRGASSLNWRQSFRTQAQARSRLGMRRCG